MAKKKSKPNNQTLMLAAVAILLAVLIVLVATKSSQPPADQNKISTIPTEIKSSQEATALQQDTASILKDVQGSLSKIDESLPDV